MVRRNREDWLVSLNPPPTLKIIRTRESEGFIKTKIYQWIVYERFYGGDGEYKLAKK